MIRTEPPAARRSAPRSRVDDATDAPARRRLPILLRRAWYGMNQAFRRRIAHLGITPDQFTVMRNVLENGDLSQRELTSLMASDPNTIAALLERMETAGLVERRSCDRDRRAKRLTLTPRGRKTYSEAQKIALNLQSQIIEAVPEDQRERFLDNLLQISEFCQTAARTRQPKS